MDKAKRDALKCSLNEAMDFFSQTMNEKAKDYSRNGYNEDAVLMMDELARQTFYLASSFRDAILEALS